MNHAPKVAIIVLNWNGKQDTLECLDSVFKIDYPNFEAVVVDNGSSDDSVPAIRRAFPQAHLIETGRNLGYAGGNNVGIRHALANGAEFVFILNNDTVVAPDTITHLVDTAQAYPQAGIVAPKMYYFDQPKILWSAGGYWDEEAQCFEQLGDGELDRGQYDRVAEHEFLVGCALLIRGDCLRKIGLLDETFFLNYEEIDFEFRAKKAGFGLYLCPQAKIWHKVSASFGSETSPLKTYFTYRNRLLWSKRHLSRRKHYRLLWSVYSALYKHITAPLRAEVPRSPKHLFWSLHGITKSPSIRAISRAILDYHLRRFGDCPPAIRKLNDAVAETATTRGNSEKAI